MADEQTQPLPRWAVPVEIIVSPETVQNRELDEKLSNIREIEAIDLQRSLNIATQQMASTAVYQTIFIAIGTFALLYTLYLTRQTILVTREIGQKQTRAYLSITPLMLRVEPNSVPRADFSIKNSGNSPARKVRFVAGLTVEKHPLDPSIEYLIELSPDSVAPGLTIASLDEHAGEAILDRPLSHSDLDQIMLGDHEKIYMTCFVDYLDVFDSPRRTELSVVWGNTGEFVRSDRGRPMPVQGWVSIRSKAT